MNLFLIFHKVISSGARFRYYFEPMSGTFFYTHLQRQSHSLPSPGCKWRRFGLGSAIREHPKKMDVLGRDTDVAKMLQEVREVIRRYLESIESITLSITGPPINYGDRT
jgi:hypothetical protein